MEAASHQTGELSTTNLRRKTGSATLSDKIVRRFNGVALDERLHMNPENIIGWSANWAWGLPLIVFTVILHAYSLGLLNTEVTARLNKRGRLGRPSSVQSFLIGGTALSLTVLHGVEGVIWATAYRLLGASIDNKSAMLYSLNALTSYGHEELHLAPHWKMMGALEALNGWILFGLTTAFLFTVVQRAWLQSSPEQIHAAESAPATRNA
jgi:hypothetical protein